MSDPNKGAGTGREGCHPPQHELPSPLLPAIGHHAAGPPWLLRTHSLSRPNNPMHRSHKAGRKQMETALNRNPCEQPSGYTSQFETEGKGSLVGRFASMRLMPHQSMRPDEQSSGARLVLSSYWRFRQRIGTPPPRPLRIRRSSPRLYVGRLEPAPRSEYDRKPGTYQTVAARFNSISGNVHCRIVV